mmetsp:Transcript_37823/g.69137  ORF Transcript_37823/g.69137 Transcript_37823/m.69137 type:complete len:319 (+) Transcript_37823:115-1071(+)
MAPKVHILKTAPPSLLVVALVGVVGAICVSLLPSLKDIDSIATLQLLTTSAHLDTVTLAYLRAVFASIIFAVQGNIFFTSWEEHVTYLKGSKLKDCLVRFEGPTTLMWFTAQSWVLLGLYFAGASYLGFLHASANQPLSAPTLALLLRAVLVLWEIAAPNAMLVSTVVTYVIWPEVLAKGGPALTEGLRRPLVLMQHNANVVFVFANLALTATPLVASHAAIAPLFGLVYVVFFAWLPAPFISPQNGVTYLYFFFDTTLGPKFGCLALLALLGCLLLFYGLAVGVVTGLAFLASKGAPLAPQFAAVAVLCVSICRVRD